MPPASDAPADGGANNDQAPTNEPLPGGLPANDPNGESTTPEEVAKTLRSSGIKLPEGNVEDDAEEGDDPDAEDPKDPAGDEDAGNDDEPTADEEANEDEPEEDQPEDKAPPKRTTPDDFAADENKYAFEVTDANGVTFKIAPGATLEEILAEFEPKNNGQVIDILNKLQKAEAAQAADEAQAAEDEAKAAQAKRASEFLETWDTEAKDLQAQKRIPEGKDGDQRIADVYKFMADENDKRMNAGKPAIQSFEDALNILEAQEARQKVVEDAKAEKEAARKNGGLVGGSSAPASGESPVYKAGTARNANEALRKMKLLD